MERSKAVKKEAIKAEDSKEAMFNPETEQMEQLPDACHSLQLADELVGRILS